MTLDETRIPTGAARAPEPTVELDLEDDRDAGRSNFAAFLLGGVVVSAGLLGFLYYDIDEATRRDGLTVGDLPAVSRTIAPPPAAQPLPAAPAR